MNISRELQAFAAYRVSHSRRNKVARHVLRDGVVVRWSFASAERPQEERTSEFLVAAPTALTTFRTLS